MQWLFEAKKRYGLVILNYVVTSNHLIVHGKDGGETIPKSIQLIAGRTGQEYNQRKKRKGAFWEDRYHATAIEAGEHLLRCLVYVDLNMVRCGVVSHPGQWPHGGYNEIQCPLYSYSSGAAEVLSVGDNQVATTVQIQDCITQINHGKVWGSLGGLSGGPVFAWRKTPVLIAELIGFIYEYQESLDLMLVRSAVVIREDGTLDA